MTGHLHEESCDECNAFETRIGILFHQIGRQNKKTNALLNARISCLNRMTQCSTYTLTIEDHDKLIELIVKCTRQVRDTELEFYKVLNTEAKHGGPTHTACLDPRIIMFRITRDQYSSNAYSNKVVELQSLNWEAPLRERLEQEFNIITTNIRTKREFDRARLIKTPDSNLDFPV